MPELPKQSKCERCETSIDISDKDWVRDIYGKLTFLKKYCLNCSVLVQEEEKRQREKDLESAYQKRIDRIPYIVSAMLPKKFSSLSNSISLPESLRRFIPPCDRGLCLTGGTGVGKTTSVCLLLREHLEIMAADKKWGKSDWFSRGSEGEPVGRWADSFGWKFISYPKFIMKLQDSYRKDSSEESAYQTLEKMSEVPFLIIDDLGAEKPTEFVRQATYFLINEREMNMKTTFITTNFPLSFLDENIDPRIASRIAGMCEVIEMKGKDRRFS